MTRILASLEERGLVGRTPHPSDGRQILVATTSQATSLLKADRRRRDEWLSRRLTELTPDELAALRAAAPVLDKLAAT